jgi:hypothetical protein
VFCKSDETGRTFDLAAGAVRKTERFQSQLEARRQVRAGASVGIVPDPRKKEGKTVALE